MASAVFVGGLGVSTVLSPLNLTFVGTNIQISCYFLANSSAQGSGKFPHKVDDVLADEEGTTGRDLKHRIVWPCDIIACFATSTSILLFVMNLARLGVNLIVVEMFATVLHLRWIKSFAALNLYKDSLAIKSIWDRI